MAVEGAACRRLWLRPPGAHSRVFHGIPPCGYGSNRSMDGSRGHPSRYLPTMAWGEPTVAIVGTTCRVGRRRGRDVGPRSLRAGAEWANAHVRGSCHVRSVVADGVCVAGERTTSRPSWSRRGCPSRAPSAPRPAVQDSAVARTLEGPSGLGWAPVARTRRRTRRGAPPRARCGPASVAPVEGVEGAAVDGSHGGPAARAVGALNRAEAGEDLGACVVEVAAAGPDGAPRRRDRPTLEPAGGAAAAAGRASRGWEATAWRSVGLRQGPRTEPAQSASAGVARRVGRP